MATEFDEAEILNDITGSTDPILIPGKGAQAMPKRNAVVIAARKETALATVLRAQQREGYRADHLVGPICRHVLLAKNNSTASQLRLAVDVVGHANVVAEDIAVDRSPPALRTTSRRALFPCSLSHVDSSSFDADGRRRADGGRDRGFDRDARRSMRCDGIGSCPAWT